MEEGSCQNGYDQLRHFNYVASRHNVVEVGRIRIEHA